MPDSPVSPVKVEESATTREEMDFDGSDQEQETGKVSPLGTETPTAPTKTTKPRVSFQTGPVDEIPPSKPPRPLSPLQQAENTLVEAFPSIDTKIIQAVLHASGGQVEPAFNALLGMTDPTYRPEEVAPARPPRPTQRQPLSQLEADELYARQLAEQYNSAGQQRGHLYNQREPGRRGPNQQRPPYGEEDREHSFFDDDLPEIGRNIQQGFLQTQKTVNNWLSNFKKRLDGEEEDDLYSGAGSGQRSGSGGATQGGAGTWGGRKDFGPSQREQLYGIQKHVERHRRSMERQSMDAQRYDQDAGMIGDDEFQQLELRDDEGPPPKPPRSSSMQKTANPDLFKHSPRAPQSGPVDEVDAAERAASQSNNGSGKKWQPLTSVAPHPEDDNDPFSVGDDDEDVSKAEDLRKEDSARLKEKANQSISEGKSGSIDGKILAESEGGSAGVRNKEAEEILSGKKG